MGFLDFFRTPIVYNNDSFNHSKRSETEEKGLVKVTATDELKRNLKVELSVKVDELALYCPIHNAKIFIHSNIVDQMGDISKFVISSLYQGHSVEEISSLTRLGEATINEEVEYLVNGGLLENDKQTLTDLGEQYGLLIKTVSDTAEGVSVLYNSFTNKFELVDTGEYAISPKEKFILKSRGNPIEMRNDDFANSRKLAEQYLEKECKLIKEISRSIYTTVKVTKKIDKYKPVYVQDFSHGYNYDLGGCVKIAIPIEKITCKPRYKWIDKYREIIPKISEFDKRFYDLLSDKAKELIISIQEENDCECLIENVNAITGEFVANSDVSDVLSVDESVFMMDTRPVQLCLKGEASKGVYLEEMNREPRFLVRYFSYIEKEE